MIMFYYQYSVGDNRIILHSQKVWAPIFNIERDFACLDLHLMLFLV